MDAAEDDCHTLEIEPMLPTSQYLNKLTIDGLHGHALKKSTSEPRTDQPPKGHSRSSSDPSSCFTSRPSSLVKQRSSKQACHRVTLASHPKVSFGAVEASLPAPPSISAPVPSQPVSSLATVAAVGEEADGFPAIRSVSMPVVRFEPLTASFANVAHRWSPQLSDDYQMLDQDDDSPTTRKRVWLQPESERWLPADLCHSQDGALLNSGEWVFDDAAMEDAQEFLIVDDSPDPHAAASPVGFAAAGRRCSV